jgi:GAF domain-containing protein
MGPELSPGDDLLGVVRDLSFCRTLPDVMDIVRVAARRLTGADGVTFVLRDGDQCHYAEENAIAPLWKGRRFPMRDCISGWVMLNRQPVAIPDIYLDLRIPHDAYRPTFVRSLAMVPVRAADPLGAIGAYWATEHAATAEETGYLQAVADAAALALENVKLYQGLQAKTASR